MDTPTLESARFILRPLDPSDVTALFPTLSDPEQCAYMSRPSFESEAELSGWLFDPTWNGRTWIAADNRDQGVVGRFVAVPGPDSGVAELGYVTLKDRQGQGVARECLSALITHLFQVEGRRRLFVEIDARNLASVRVAENLGFKREALLREHEVTHAGLCDLAVYGLLRRDWVS